MLGKDPFLGAIMSTFYASSPSTSEIPQEMLLCTESLMTQLHLGNLSNSHVLRERRGRGRISLGPHPSLYFLIHPSNILLPRAGSGGFSRHVLKGCLVWRCHFLGSLPLLYCRGASIPFVLVCVWMSSPSLVVYPLPLLLIPWQSALPNPCLRVGLLYWDDRCRKQFFWLESALPMWTGDVGNNTSMHRPSLAPQ